MEDNQPFAALVANHVDAMLVYWDKGLICRFANQAYLLWFGRTPEEMIDTIHMQDLLGPLFEKNPPHIQRVLAGERQTFEREILTPSGLRYSLANYYPDLRDGEVRGFFVHVADITQLKVLALQREAILGQLISAQQEIKVLKGLLPICSWCKKIRDDGGYCGPRQVAEVKLRGPRLRRRGHDPD